jgi:hypothetical protein
MIFGGPSGGGNNGAMQRGKHAARRTRRHGQRQHDRHHDLGAGLGRLGRLGDGARYQAENDGKRFIIKL